MPRSRFHPHHRRAWRGGIPLRPLFWKKLAPLLISTACHDTAAPDSGTAPFVLGYRLSCCRGFTGRFSEPVDISGVTREDKQKVGGQNESTTSNQSPDIYDGGVTHPAAIPKGVADVVDREVRSGLGKNDVPATTVITEYHDTGLQKIASLFGKKLYSVQMEGVGTQTFGGLVVRSFPTAIFLDANATYPHLQILGYELGHLLRKDHPDLYDYLIKYVGIVGGIGSY